jgi:hypothetical protein
VSTTLAVNFSVGTAGKMYLYVKSTTQRFPNKIINTHLIGDFFHLELQISPQIFEKIRNGLNGILRGLGKLIHKKT